MFEKHINEMIEACYEETLQSTNKRIKKAVAKIQKDLPNDYENFLRVMLTNMISDMMSSDLPNAVKNDMYEEFIEGFSQDALDLRKAAIFKVVLKGHEKEIYRKIKIPYKSTLADLGYVILATFEADGEHFFHINHKRNVYYCDSNVEVENDLPASEVLLEELQLKAGGKLSMCYDFGDEYNFIITFVEMQLCETILDSDVIEILSGEGYGIWENAHHELDLYYEDTKKFEAYIEEHGLAKRGYPLHEEFDLEEANDLLKEKLFNIKLGYEGFLDEDDYFEEEMTNFLA